MQLINRLFSDRNSICSWLLDVHIFNLAYQRHQQSKACAAEIEFWRTRNASFVSLYEQLNMASVKKCVSVLEAGSADQNLLTSFKAQFNELKKVSFKASG